MERLSAQITLVRMISACLLSLIITACGGGSSGDTTPVTVPPTDPLESLPYTGLTSPATITSSDLTSIMEQIESGQFSINPAQSITATSSAQMSQSAAQLPAAQASQDTIGLCGGVMTLTATVNEASGQFEGQAVYNQYNDCELLINGTMLISGQVDINTGRLIIAVVSFELLELTEGSQETNVWSGTSTIAEYWPSTGWPYDTVSFDMRVRLGSNNKVYWYDNFQLKVTYGFESRAYEEETIISGRLYDPDLGYIDLYTTAPLRTYEGDNWASEGRLVIASSDNVTAGFTYISPGVFFAEADFDGDGSYEYTSDSIHFPGANTLPVAVAGEDSVGNVSCLSQLNANQSYDLDQDNLTYQWSLATIPQGSSAQIISADSATASFTPDVRGDYQLTLSVSDGYAATEDTLQITAYGELYCLNSIYSQPYAAIGQYEAGIAVGDINNDSRDDILALTQESELWTITQNASGGMNTPANHSVVNWRKVAVGDVSGDGRNDAVITTDAGVGVLQQSDTGTLSTMVEYLFDPPLANPAYTYSLDLGDLNHDGRLDAAVMPLGSTIYVFLQDVNGGFTTPSAYQLLSGSWGQVITADVTGDGLTDIIASRADSSAANNIAVLAQDASGNFPVITYYSIGNLPYTYTSTFVIGDLTGDGRNDLAYNQYDDVNGVYQIGILTQTDTGSFASPIFIDAYYPPVKEMVISDVTGDGRNDLVALHGTPSTAMPFVPITVAVFAATTSGGLEAYDIYPISQTPQSWGGLAVGDLNSDGRKDIAITAHGCNGYDCGPWLNILYGNQ